MVLVPQTTNAQYGGSPWAWRFLLALAALNLARGSIHLIVGDGGAGRIAGIDLSENREVIVFLFAVMGLHQLAFGVLDLVVALRYRSFVPLLLTVETVKQAIAVAVGWFYKPMPVEAPGKYGAILLLLLLLPALLLSLRPRRETTPNPRAAEGG
jgi:hypothetical protein